MVGHIAKKFKEEVSERLTRKWEIDCKEKEEISVEIFKNKKEDWIEEKVTKGSEMIPLTRTKNDMEVPEKIREGISNKEEGQFLENMAKTDPAEKEIKVEEDKITGEDREVAVKVEGEDQGGQ